MERYFEPVHLSESFHIPVRKTNCSAGYDFATHEEIIILPFEIIIVMTNVRVYMPSDEYLQISMRSSLAKKGLMMPKPVLISEGTRIAQGIFLKYYTRGDIIKNERIGGFGSTDKIYN